jgi:ABC-type lipoprotein release transport system permease subunit
LSRRGRDLAVLRTLGFSPAQVRRTIAWQSTTLAVIALGVGLPVGVAVGRLLWTLVANEIGTLAEGAVPGLSLAVLVPVALLVANLVAAGPAWLASRARPGPLLRTE